MNNTPLRAVALVCTLSPSPKPSSSQLLAEQTMAALAEHGVTGKTIRTDYQDLDKTPEKSAATNKTLAANTAHLARRLKASPYPPAWMSPHSTRQARSGPAVPLSRRSHHPGSCE
ncbi:hypothetical protein [Streptomyces sp. 3211]|uniref:hypothetical protein n=1 Tax=Streptomyces sp. 3211 TaxID=1964449 RepID=UPI0017FCACAF